jgi:hypothetical protein
VPWVLHLLDRVAADVWSTVAADWPYLLLSILAAAAVPVYLGTDRLGAWMSRRRRVAIGAAVLLATLTPFCSCGTTAIVLGMLATRTPWAPIVAFMVASPLTSPEELLLSAGLFGWPFALIFFTGTIALGFAAGAVTDLLERTGWLAGQARMHDPGCPPVTCPAPARAPDGSTAAGTATTAAVLQTGIAARLRLPGRSRCETNALATTARRILATGPNRWPGEPPPLRFPGRRWSATVPSGSARRGRARSVRRTAPGSRPQLRRAATGPPWCAAARSRRAAPPVASATLARLGPAKPGRSSQVWCSWIIFSGVAWKALAPQRHDSALDLLIRTSRHGHHASASGRRRSVSLTASPRVSLRQNGSEAGMARRAGAKPR